MRYSPASTGNCLLGALVLRLRTSGARLRVRWEGGLPHFYVTDDWGQAYYFRYLEDYGPFRWKLWWIWYRGEYVSLPVSKLKSNHGQATHSELHGAVSAQSEPLPVERPCAS